MKPLAALLGAMLAAACSGGGGGSPSPAPPPDATGPATTTVSGLSPFDAACGGTGGVNYPGAEVEPHVAANPLNPSHLVGAWQQDRWSNGSARGIVNGVSFDGGVTWTLSQPRVSNCNGGNASNGGNYLRATDPWVAFAADGTVHQITLSTSGGTFGAGSSNAVLASRSTDGGRTWSDPVTVLRNGPEFFSDKETLTADPADARFLYAVWDRLIPGANAPTLFSRSTDGGLTWEAARVIEDFPPDAQSIGNLIRVLPNGTLVNLYARLVGSEDNVGDASLEVIRSTDRGVNWSAPVRVAAFNPLGARDPTTGVPIRDGAIIPQMAVAPGGALYVVWQEGSFAGTRDGIAFSRSTDGGLTWSAPARINGNPAVQAFMPQVHVRADGVIGVTYFDLRSDTADAPLLTDYWLLRSSDGGATWNETRVSPAFDLSTAPLVDGQYFIGDYMGLASVGDVFVAFYTRTTGNTATNRTDVFATRIGPATAASQVIAEAKAAAGDGWQRRSLEYLSRAKALRRAR